VSRSHDPPGVNSTGLSSLLRPSSALGKPTESATTKLVAEGSPLDIALSNYELQFLHTLQNSEAYANAAEARFQLAQQMLEELRVQHRAGHGAVLNLGDHAEPLRLAFRHIEQAVTEQRTANEALLDQFLPALSALNTISLHPALEKEDLDVRTLADCVPVDKEEAWLEQCKIGHQQLYSRLETTRLNFNGIDRDARSLMESIRLPGSADSTDFSPLPDEEELEQHLSTLREIAESQKRYHSEDKEEYERVKDTVTKQLESPSSMNASTTALETCRNFEELLQRKQNRFEEWTAADRNSCNACLAVVEHKQRSTRKLGTCLQIISKLQYKIQKLHQHLSVLRTMKERQDQDFRHLEHIIYLKDAYEAFLVEVARRRSYARSFSDKIGESIETIAEFRGVEVERRERFWRHHGHHLPPIFYSWMPSLAKPPPYFSPEAPASEGALPEIQMTLPIEEPSSGAGPDADEAEGSGAFKGSVILEAEDPSEDATAHERQRQVQSQLEYENLSLKAEIHQLQAQIAKLEQRAPEAQDGSARDAQQVPPPVETSTSEKSPPPPTATGADEDASLRGTLVQLVEDVVMQPEERRMLVSTIREGFDQAFLGTLLLQIRENVQELKLRLERSSAASDQRISYGMLDVGDVALFLPTQPSPEDNQYRPFVAGGCNMFMHPQSVSAARQQNNMQKPDFVVGRIVQKENFDANEHRELHLSEDPETCWVAQVEILFSAFGPTEADPGV